MLGQKVLVVQYSNLDFTRMLIKKTVVTITPEFTLCFNSVTKSSYFSDAHLSPPSLNDRSYHKTTDNRLNQSGF